MVPAVTGLAVCMGVEEGSPGSGGGEVRYDGDENRGEGGVESPAGGEGEKERGRQRKRGAQRKAERARERGAEKLGGAERGEGRQRERGGKGEAEKET